jgi:hypothetical protein
MALKPLPLMLNANGVPVAKDFSGLSYAARNRLIMFKFVTGPEKLADLIWPRGDCSANSTVSGHNPSG